MIEQIKKWLNEELTNDFRKGMVFGASLAIVIFAVTSFLMLWLIW